MNFRPDALGETFAEDHFDPFGPEVPMGQVWRAFGAVYIRRSGEVEILYDEKDEPDLVRIRPSNVSGELLLKINPAGHILDVRWNDERSCPWSGSGPSGEPSP